MRKIISGVRYNGAVAARARRRLATMLVAATLLPTLAAAVQFSRGQVLAGCVAAVPLATEAYARAPPSWRKSDLPRIDIKSDDVVVKFDDVDVKSGGVTVKFDDTAVKFADNNVRQKC